MHQHVFFGAILIAGTSLQGANCIFRLYQPPWTDRMQNLSIFGVTLVYFVVRKVAKDAKMGRYCLFVFCSKSILHRNSLSTKRQRDPSLGYNGGYTTNDTPIRRVAVDVRLVKKGQNEAKRPSPGTNCILRKRESPLIQYLGRRIQYSLWDVVT